MQSDLTAALKKLSKVEPYIRKTLRKDLTEASKIIVTSTKRHAPLGTRNHGKYKPGNLRKSLRRLNLRRSKSAVYVGPLSRGGPIDGFYARYLEFGTKKIRPPKRFMERAANESGTNARISLLNILKRRIEVFRRNNQI